MKDTHGTLSVPKTSREEERIPKLFVDMFADSNDGQTSVRRVVFDLELITLLSFFDIYLHVSHVGNSCFAIQFPER